MELVGESIDDLLRQTYGAIQKLGRSNKGSRGENQELIGVTLRLTHPRARLSRSADRGLPFSALGELMWYLSGTDEVEFITAYISMYHKEVGPSGRINGAYGPRIFSKYGVDQLAEVAKLIERKPWSRRAVVQIYAASDLSIDEEVPCTTTLQFFLRENTLHLAASLRSNDAYLGLPHDAFCFTMIQEMMARRLGVGVGHYIQTVGSFHLYNKDKCKVERYLNEGHQKLAEMPEMPDGDPFLLVPRLLATEKQIRQGHQPNEEIEGYDPYWGDLLRLIQVHFASDNDQRLDAIKKRMQEKSYLTYLEDRRGRRPPSQSTSVTVETEDTLEQSK